MVCDAWSQAPPSQLIESAQEESSLPWIDSSDSNGKSKRAKRKSEKFGEYTARLGHFLNRATTVIDTLVNQVKVHQF